MNNLFFLRLAALVLPIFILISCSEKKPNLIAFSDEHVVITDSITIHLEEKMYSRGKPHRFFDDEGNMFFGSYFKERHAIKFSCINDSSLTFTVILNDSLKGSMYSYLHDFLVVSFDSIFFIPDKGKMENPIILYNKNGDIINTFQFSENHLSESNPFYFYCLLNRRMSFSYPYIITPIGFLPDNINEDYQVLGDYEEYKSRPIMAVLNTKTREFNAFHYPRFFNNVRKRTHATISYSFENKLYINWEYTPYISKYVLSKENGTFDSIKTIDIRDFVPFEDKNHLAFSGQAERLTVCDLIENIIFDDYRKRFYVILTKGIPFEDSDDVFVSSFLEKPTYILVFDEELNYLHNKKFPSAKYAEGKHTIALTKDHMLLPISDDPLKQFNQLYLIRIDLDELNK
jgi:hypothetical protein